jgi:transmembrane sensor
MGESNKGNTRIAELVFKYLVKQLSDEEKVELDKWKLSSEENRAVFNDMVQRAQLKLKLQDYNTVHSEDIWNRISRDISISLAPVSIKKNRYWYTVAAAMVPIIAICGWLYLKPGTTSNSTPTLSSTEILPGSNKGILTLANGSTIILDNVKDGSLADQGNTSVAKHGGQIVYQVDGAHMGNEIGYNTISTPRGGQYQISLADGSRVFLNAASSLRFPVAFNGAERKVIVTGEAYFEIAKDPSKPFIVVIDKADNKTEVEVLGTHFNVNGYLNEPSIQTTLLEGKVKVRNSASSNTKILSPGQQAQVLSSGTIHLKQVDTLASVAWKNGVFRFGETDVRSVLRQIERWYDVEIIYKGEIPEIDFVGQISRYSNASKVLELLEMTGGIRFQIEGKKIVVMPPESKK